jgi:hypothetical protein
LRSITVTPDAVAEPEALQTLMLTAMLPDVYTPVGDTIVFVN